MHRFPLPAAGSRWLRYGPLLLALSQPALADLLNLTQEYPKINYNGNGTIVFDPLTDQLFIDAFPTSLKMDRLDFGSPIDPTGQPLVRWTRLRVEVDDAGQLIGPGDADDLTVYGQVDTDGNGTPDYQGVLLTGRVTELGYADTPGTADKLDFRITPTGGAMAGALFPLDKDVTLTATIENSTFAGSFALPFAGIVKGLITPTVRPPCEGLIGDYVWRDEDRDGFQDANETGINGVTVLLEDAAGNPLGNFVTTNGGDLSEDGYYQFTGLCAGDYRVRVDASTLPAGLQPTLIEEGSDRTLDSNDPTGTPVNLPADDAQDITLDFGYQTPCSGAIGDYVWLDADRDGIQDPTEVGIDEVVLELLNNRTGDTETTVTVTGGPDSRPGYYRFGGLCADTYTVRVLSPLPDLLPTAIQVPGASDATDSNDPAGTTVVLTDDDSVDETRDFGYQSPCTGTLGDYVWFDQDRDGIQDPFEAGINDIRLLLTDGEGNQQSTETFTGGPDSAPGYYQFSGLCAGPYEVAVDPATVPAGYEPSPVMALGSTPADDSNDHTGIGVTLVGDDASDQSLDFGYLSPCTGTIGDFVWYDSNGNGLQEAGELGINGVTVRLVDGQGNVTTTTTAARNGQDGFYLFEGLCAGSYTVMVNATTLPDGYTVTEINAPGTTAADDSDNPAGTPVTLTGDDDQDLTRDFGYLLADPAIDVRKQEEGPDSRSVVRGATVDFAIVVTNTGNVILSDVTLTDPLLPTCDRTVGQLAPGEQFGYTCTTDQPVEAGFTNRVCATGSFEGDQVEDCDESTVEVATPAIDIRKQAEGPDSRTVVRGSDVDFEIKVTNTGQVDLVNVTVTDPLLPACDQFIGDLAVAGSVTYTCTAQNLTQPLANVAAVTGESETGEQVGDSDPSDVAVLTPAIDIRKEAEGADSRTVNEGSDVTFEIKVTNIGEVPLFDVTVTDPLAPNCDRVIGDLAVGASQTYSCTLPAVSADLTNVAQVTGRSETGEPVSDEDPSSVVVEGGGDPQGICLPTLDFDTAADGRNLQAGTIVDDEWASLGVRVYSHDQARYPAMIFDTASPTGGDWDLGTPNVDFGGPGYGSGGRAGSPGENRLAQGKVVIISEDRDSNDPDDKAGGGALYFTFDQPVRLDEVHILDIDVSSAGYVAAYDADGNVVALEYLLNLGDNSYQVVTLNARKVSKVKVKFSDSGAVAKLVFCPEDDTPTGALGDRVWKDLDGNGQQDAGEPGIPGVTLELGRNGQVLATDTTDGDGRYGFEGLEAGQYTVTVDPETLPAGLVATFDLDGLATLDTATAGLATGQTRLDVDFGYTWADDLLTSCKAAIQSGQLTGSINADGKGYLTNHTAQAFLVGMASYKKFDEVYANQELFDGKTAVIGAGQSLTFQVETPNCATQLDLFCGTVQESLAEALYGKRLIKALHTGGTQYCDQGGSHPDLGALPEGMYGKDIGHVGAEGKSGFKDGQFTVKGSGGDIWNSADAFHYVYQPWEGDVTLKVKVTGVDWTDGWAKAGLMIRNDLTPGSRHAMMVLTPGNGAAFQYRKADGGGSYHTSGGAASAPLWVKLKREGQTLIGYRSGDGQSWHEVGRVTIDMGSKVYVGLATTSHAKGQLTHATFRHYSAQSPQGGVLMVVGSTSLNGGDAKAKARLEALGLKVTVKDDDGVSTADANGRQLVVISSTVQSGKVGAKFRDVRVPLVTWEAYLYDDLKMTGASAGSDYGTKDSQYKVYLTDWGSYLQTTNAYDTFTWGRPSSSAHQVALVPGTSKAAVFAYQQEAWMKGMQAPARRVGLFLGNDTATRLTDGGWMAFDWAVKWALE